MSDWVDGTTLRPAPTRTIAPPEKSPARLSLASLVFVCVGLLVFGETDAHAYADPGSGTLLLQMAFAAFFGLMFYIRRIATWVRRLLGGHRASPPTASGSSETGSGPSGTIGGR